MTRRRTLVEIALVLGLSVGMSALYSVVSIARRLSQETPLSEQTATINRPLAPEPVFDLIYQLLGITSALVPVALVFYLVARSTRPRLAPIGLDGTQRTLDVVRGLGLAALIGIPGLGLYVAGVWLGVTVQIVPTSLEAYWWTIPVLLLQAAKASLVEEVIAVGYLMTRLREISLFPWVVIVAQATLRATYHLYQGWGPFVGNFVMGLIFGYWYHKTGRLAPLLVAHFTIDAVAFVGYPLFGQFAPDFLTGNP